VLHDLRVMSNVRRKGGDIAQYRIPAHEIAQHAQKQQGVGLAHRWLVPVSLQHLQGARPAFRLGNQESFADVRVE
jgi:hypothetical protein